ncbi:hypothetical protein C9374_005191 [Naegleria lovaniensis]|uniref:Uncharacterized protein n=1 Tax=Naegleria lovaniensis TaxID=51637 RepID=A0AA88KNI7_NAELO|nr:uncharacterized protein C9374_005191 [Naegleria lovaniensis]KAG2382611.1 hypothetical protein C9374_005191 [Naegleria lovaniensis]
MNTTRMNKIMMMSVMVMILVLNHLSFTKALHLGIHSTSSTTSSELNRKAIKTEEIPTRLAQLYAPSSSKHVNTEQASILTLEETAQLGYVYLSQGQTYSGVLTPSDNVRYFTLNIPSASSGDISINSKNIYSGSIYFSFDTPPTTTYYYYYTTFGSSTQNIRIVNTFSFSKTLYIMVKNPSIENTLSYTMKVSSFNSSMLTLGGLIGIIIGSGAGCFCCLLTCLALIAVVRISQKKRKQRMAQMQQVTTTNTNASNPMISPAQQQYHQPFLEEGHGVPGTTSSQQQYYALNN